MALEQLIIKRNAKKIVEGEPPTTEEAPNQVPFINSARTHVPTVFEHQYAEYISGLKPPYTKLGDPSGKYTTHHKRQGEQHSRGDKDL